jgi:hypothetical protein
MSPLRVALFALALFAPAPALAQQLTWTVSFDDPGGTHSAFYDRIDSHLRAAGQRWGQYMTPAANTTINTQVSFTTNVPFTTGRSATSTFVGVWNGLDLFEQGVGTMIRTGADPNGAAADILIQINPNYMQNTLWWDPNPVARTATPDANRTDAMSVMLHELGHAIAFNGWRSGTNGSLPGNYLSTFDRHVTFDGANLFFNGPNATGLYGGPLATTFDNYGHLGNRAPRPGQNLIPDLMNGVELTNGVRYDISPLDRAILADTGIPMTPVPKPASVGLVLVAVGGLGAGVRRWRS